MTPDMIISLIGFIPDLETSLYEDERKLAKIERRPIDQPRQLHGPMDLPEVDGELFKVPSEGKSWLVEYDYMEELQERIELEKTLIKKARVYRIRLEEYGGDFVKDYFDGVPKKELIEKYGYKVPLNYLRNMTKHCFHVD